MSAALAEDLDLSWVTFSGSDPVPVCSIREPERCPLEAVARFRWKPSCRHAARETCYCAAHKEMVLGIAREGRFECSRCARPIELVSVEPVR